MKKFTWTVVAVVYVLLVIAISTILASEFLFKEKPKERFFEVPQVVEQANIMPLVVKSEPKFVPAPKAGLAYVKGAVISPNVKNTDYISAIADAKKLRANLVTIALETEVDERGSVSFSGMPAFDWKPATIAMINEAHRQGMQVELRTTAVPETRFPKNFTTYLNYAGEFFRDLGDFAQEYEVYMLTVYENIEDDHNLGLYKDKINPTLQIVLGNATKFYKGEVGVGFGDQILVEDTSRYDISGYSYVILNTYPSYPKTQWGDYHLRVGELVKAAMPLKQQHGITRVILGGFGLNSNPASPYYTRILVTQSQEAQSYELIFGKYANQTDGVTVAYSTKIYGVKGRQAESAVRAFFAGH